MRPYKSFVLPFSRISLVERRKRLAVFSSGGKGGGGGVK